MALWLLLKNPDETGNAIPLIPTEDVIIYGSPECTFDISLKPDKDDDLYRSSKHGGQQGFALLWREGHVRQSVIAEFELDVPPNVHGNSADLLFALAVATHIIPSKESGYPPIAATGCLNEKGYVERVEGVFGKLHAALATLPTGGIVFYPLSNDTDVDSALRQKAAACQITLCPIERLEQAVERLGITINKVYLKSPYRGLEAFHAEHRSIYFGRQAEIETLITQLLAREQKQTTGVLIIAASGTGKSSLVQAGLVPALQQGRLALKDRRVFSTVWQPSDSGAIINELSLVQSLVANWQKQAELLPLESATIQTLEQLSAVLANTLPSNQRFVWVLNQMEELFTLDFSEALLKTFCDFLHGLQKIGVWVIGTLRNDFYGSYQAQPALLAMFGSSGVYDLPALDVAALRQIIEEPAHLADVRFEINAQQISLADRLLDDMAGNTEALPLLEFMLQQLYNARVEGVMTYAHYEQLGGLMGSIGHRAEIVFSTLDDHAQATLPRLLWKLAAKGQDDARKQIVAQAIYLNDVADHDPIRYLITAFIEQRLLIQDNENKQALKVRVAHEALLTHWRRAKDIIDGFIDDKPLHDQLQSQAQDWHLATPSEKEGFLIVAGEPLIRAEGLLERRGDELLPPDLLALIKASIARRNALFWRNLSAVVLVFLVVSGFAVVAYIQKNEAEKQTDLALATEKKAKDSESETKYRIKLELIRKLSNQAKLAIEYPNYINGNPNHSFLMAVQAFKLAPDSATAQGALLDILQSTYISKFLYSDREISAVAFSPDGKKVVSGNSDSTLVLWDVESGKTIGNPWDVERDNPWMSINSVSFSPNGKFVASGDSSGASLWDVNNGEIIKSFYVPLENPKSSGVRIVKFNSDGKYLITAIDSLEQTLMLWNIHTGKAIGEPWLKHDELVDSLDISSDGKKVITGSHNQNSLKLWDTSSGKIIGNPWKIDKSNVVAFSPDSKKVITAGKDYLKLWDIKTGKQIGNNLKGYLGNATSIFFNKKNSQQLIIGENNSLTLRNIYIEEQIIQLWKGDRNSVEYVDLSQDGRQIVSAGYLSKDLMLFDINSINDLVLFSIPEDKNKIIRGSSFNSNKNLLAISDDNGFFIWNATNGNIIKHWNQEVSTIAISPDGTKVISSNKDHLKLLDINSGKIIENSWQEDDSYYDNFVFPETDILNLIFSPNGKLVVSSNREGILTLWDVNSGKPIKHFNHGSWVCSIAFSPNGKLIISGGFDGRLALWNIEKSGEIGLDWIGHDDEINSISFSPDGKRFASADRRTLKIWNIDDRKQIGLTLNMGGEAIAFSPDGKRIVIGSDGADKSGLMILDVDSGKLIGKPWKLWEGMFRSLSFSSDGKKIIATSSYSPLIIIDADPNSWANRLCKKANRNFSNEEWKKFVGEDVFPHQKTCEQFPL